MGRKINIENKEIKNEESITILGTKLHNSLLFNYNLYEGKDSLISQFKRRANAIKQISKFADKKFTLNIANAILIGKINYHLVVWENLSKTSREKVDNIIINTAKDIIKSEAFGKTDDNILKQVKWI